LKVAIITDTHWGARNDSLAFIQFFEKFYTNVFIPKLIEEKIDTVLMLGDTFDRRKYTNHVSLHHAKKIYFDPLQKMGIKIHMIVGNHDTAYKNTNDVNSPSLLLTEYDNINVIDTPQTIHLDYGNMSADVCMMPWICADNYQQSLDEMKNTKADLCMGHFEISGFAMYRGHESQDGLSKEIFNKFDMVFSGHYHHRSDDGHIYYLGNPYELTWQDYNDTRGFHLFDLSNRSLEFVPNPYTMFARIEYNDKDQEPVDLNSLQLKDCYLKLIVVNKTDYYKFDKFIQKLYTKGCIDIKIIEDMSEFSEGEVADDINLEDTISVLTNYIDSVETDVDKEEIKTFMKSLYTEAVNIEVV